jgi:hypothetical protein
MLALTRRRDPEAQQETWLIYCGDVRVGVIAQRTGNPTGSPGWQWSCGFYPGSSPADHARGTAETFDQARGAFEVAWRFFLAKRTDGNFDAYRRDRAFHAWKQAMWAKGLKLPTQVDGRAVCFCGAVISIADMNQHILAAHMEPEVAPEAK